MSKVFVNISLSLDGYMAPGGMTLENWDKPQYKDWGAKWGALMGWAAEFSGVSAASLALYAAAIAWTIGYDTIYALQDIEDDAIVGVRSTARRMGAGVKKGVGYFYIVAAVLAALAPVLKTHEPLTALAATPFAAHLYWQVKHLERDDPALALRLFKSNRGAGLLLVLGYALLVALMPPHFLELTRV